MSETFKKKCEEIRKKFQLLPAEERYRELIRMGQSLPLFPSEFKTPDRVVRGCQSTLYLVLIQENGKCFFQADSEALISKGLAALLISVYSGETSEIILKHPPEFITQIGITASLSPMRANGLSQIYLRMKQEALKTFL